jgi:hypothetical protein
MNFEEIIKNPNWEEFQFLRKITKKPIRQTKLCKEAKITDVTLRSNIKQLLEILE